MKPTRWAFSVAAAAMAVAAGCDPVASDNYEGKVLATLHTLVATATPGSGPGAPAEPAPAIPPLELAAVWGRPDGNSVKFVAEKLPIAGMFPAEFTLRLHHPPPVSAMWNVGGVNLGLAFVTALEKSDWKAGTVLELGRGVKSYGESAEIVAYLDRTVAADDPFAVVFGVRQAGFHIVRQVELTADQAASWLVACRKLLPEDACKPNSQGGSGGSGSGGTSETSTNGLAEVADGLAHVMKVEISPYPKILEGGGEPPASTPPTPSTLGGGAIGPGSASGSGSSGPLPPTMKP